MANHDTDEPILAQSADQQLSEREKYNIISDTAVGVNVRWSDNAFQAIVILVTTMLLAFTGAIAAATTPDWELPWYGGAMIGGFAGLVLGFLGSGIYLMIYRAVRHLQGKHD